jgi:hypothetical protein
MMSRVNRIDAHCRISVVNLSSCTLVLTEYCGKIRSRAVSIHSFMCSLIQYVVPCMMVLMKVVVCA